jgi:hypothetical protein
MARLSIPEKYQAGVAKIRELDDITVQQLRSALDQLVAKRVERPSTSPSQPVTELTAQAIESISLRDRPDMRDIAAALASMYAVKQQRDYSTDEFVGLIADALQEVDQLKIDERESFTKKLHALLDSDVFNIIAKIEDLATEDERRFCHARILTDLRPVFGNNPADGFKAMIVMHHLKLAFHTNSPGDHDLHVVLDAEDLQELRRVIDRAEAKAHSLKATLKNVRLFGVE